MFDNNIEFKSKTFLFLLVVICTLFFIVVIKAFDYLPKEEYGEIQNNMVTTGHNATQPNLTEENENKKADDEEASDIEENSEDDIEITAASVDESEDIDEVPELNTKIVKNQDSTNVTAIDSQNPIQNLYEAGKLKNESKYNEAIEEYKSVIDNTQDKELIASAYEGLSTVYAINKKYGTALSFALKAYHEAPNSARALLIAKIYYKTGDTERATKIVNKLLLDDIK